MKTYRTNAVMAGALYILGTVAGILSVVAVGGFPDEDFLARMTSDPSRLTLGAFFILIMGFSLAAMTLFLYPLFRKDSEALAMGMGLWLIIKGFSPDAVKELDGARQHTQTDQAASASDNRNGKRGGYQGLKILEFSSVKKGIAYLLLRVRLCAVLTVGATTVSPETRESSYSQFDKHLKAERIKHEHARDHNNAGR